MTATERVYYELDRQGKKGSDLCRHLNITTSLLAGWKKQNTFPPAQYLAGIAEFLEVTVDYLLTGKEKEPPEDGQPILHDAKNNVIEDQPGAERLLRLRADSALTQRIQEVAREVYQKAGDRGSEG